MSPPTYLVTVTAQSADSTAASSTMGAAGTCADGRASAHIPEMRSSVRSTGEAVVVPDAPRADEDAVVGIRGY